MRGSSCIVVVIGVKSAIASRSTPFVHLAHTRIMSTLPLIHGSFGTVDAARTWKEDGFALFGEESEDDRLTIGPIVWHDGETIFGIQRTALPSGESRKKESVEQQEDVVMYVDERASFRVGRCR